jgi:hypothetical protein
MEAERRAPAPVLILRPTVFLPCHTLDDFPSWLDEQDADELLAAWTTAWHPAVIATGRTMPAWASADLSPPADAALLGIVPAFCDDRFAAQFDAAVTNDSRWVRGVAGRAALSEAVATAAGLTRGATGDLPAATWADDFQALGLGVLLSELLARRMRSATDLDAGGFAAAVVDAARAAVAGRDDDARAGLQECFGWLESWRARYYPVDFWVLDLVLLAASTLGRPLARELEAGVPLGIVASSDLLAMLARDHAALRERLRERVAAGTVSLCGGAADDRPLDPLLPEELQAWLAAGIATCREVTAAAPATFARYAGGSSAILPQLLTGLGIDSAVWGFFDGSPLPDPGTGRIRWEGTGGGSVEAVTQPPLDARTARAVLTLPERIGDALDHDHVAVVTFAHHAGTAGPWHDLLRRIGRWTTALGTFVTPAEFFARTAGSGTPASFEPDAFAPERPPATGAATAIDRWIAAVQASAAAVVAARAPLTPLIAAAPLATTRPAGGAAAAGDRGWWATAGGWFGLAPRETAARVLDNGLVRLEAHATTGGMLSFRRPCDRGNRLSQQLAIRLGPEGLTRMQADAIVRGRTASGRDGLVATGRLLAAGDREAGRFRQGVSLVEGLPLAVLDIEVVPAAALTGPLYDAHACCRFAWNENEAVDVCRSLHGQSIVTERSRFTAPHFIELLGGGGLRAAASDDRDAVAILTGGLPWHMRSSPHVLDSILSAAGAAAGTAITRRVAIGLGLERPWDLSLDLLAGVPLGPAPVLVPSGVRLVAAPAAVGGDDSARMRIGIVESAGRPGPVRIEWAVPVARVRAVDLRGEPRDDVEVAIVGQAVVASLRRYEWVQLELEFGT